MDKPTSKSEQVPKRPYARPELNVIELRTDEVLGVGCKTLNDFVPQSVCGSSQCGTQVGS